MPSPLRATRPAHRKLAVTKTLKLYKVAPFTSSLAASGVYVQSKGQTGMDVEVANK